MLESRDACLWRPQTGPHRRADLREPRAVLAAGTWPWQGHRAAGSATAGTGDADVRKALGTCGQAGQGKDMVA